MNALTLQKRIEQANAEGRIACIPFITAGYPDSQRFLQVLRELDENGADIIEVGVPFTDPVADGPVVEEASQRVLAQGMSLHWIIEALTNLKPRLKAGLVLMGYYNPFYQYGLEKLAKDAALAGIQGLIVPDLPLEEAAPLQKALELQKIDLITLIGLNTSEARMQEYAKKATGYVYVASVMGTTGVRTVLPEEAVAQTIARAQKIFSLPIALGFGLKSAAQVREMKVQPQAAVFGSALIKHIDEGGSVPEFMTRWK